MFTVATPDDETRWRHVGLGLGLGLGLRLGLGLALTLTLILTRHAKDEFPEHPGLLLKYPKEFDLAVAACGAEASARFPQP